MSGRPPARDPAAPSAPALTVVGIGADGWPGLGDRARELLRRARAIHGSARQLALLPDDVGPRHPWPTPLAPALDALVATATPIPTATPTTPTAAPLVVLASGDPMLHGIGATLARRLGPERIEVIPHPSAFALACARLGWPEAETTLLSTVARPVDEVAGWLQPARRLVVYLDAPRGAAELAAFLVEVGFGASRFLVMSDLGGPTEVVRETTAAAHASEDEPRIHLVAVEPRPDPGTPALPRVPGLPDPAYRSDGQLTKRHLRALALAELAPMPGALLWDVGAGSGSIAIEFLRSEPTARAIAVERDVERAARIEQNARRLGAGRLAVRIGEAPAVLPDLPGTPDRIFLGGGVSAPEMITTALRALAPGGILVAHAVTLESERALIDARAAHGGTLVRIGVDHAAPIGSFTGWRPQMPVVQYAVRP